MEAGSIAIELVRDCDTLNPSHTERLRRIYVQSFPAEQRSLVAEISRRIHDQHCSMHVAFADGEPVGFAVWAGLPNAQAAALEYLAVDASRRSLGLGGQLLERVAATVEHQSGLGIIFEVEPTEPGSDQASDRARRVAFYRRHGARPIDAAPDYAMPSFTGGPPKPMTLFWLPVQGPSQPKGELLRSLVTDLYAVSYGKSAGDQLVARSLDALRT